jgi:hypothetical protein
MERKPCGIHTHSSTYVPFYSYFREFDRLIQNFRDFQWLIYWVTVIIITDIVGSFSFFASIVINITTRIRVRVRVRVCGTDFAGEGYSFMADVWHSYIDS